MEDQLITFETAKLAKQKGFDEYCIDTFDSLGKNSGRYNIETFEDMTEEELKAEMEFRNSHLEALAEINGFSPAYITRPSQSLLQQWLIEVHKIYVCPDYRKKGWKYHFEVLSIDKDYDYIEKERYFDSHKEALEAGLQEALKLIKK